MGRDTTGANTATSVLGERDVSKLRAYRIVGRRFHSLVVLEVVEGWSDSQEIRVLCQCDCGRKTSVRHKSLRDNGSGTKSCGCAIASANARKRVDLTGKKIGLLTVLYVHAERIRSRIYWRCKCECGREVDKPHGLLTGTCGKSRERYSCGCSAYTANKKKIIDRTGERFGRLVVQSQERGRNGVTYFICKCDCGRESRVRGPNILRTQSCGCLRDERTCYTAPSGHRVPKMLPDNMGLWNRWLRQYKDGAVRRKVTWEISDELAIETMKMPCRYCGKPFSKHQTNRHISLLVNGIDRLDNSLGYTKENVVPCCTTCNIAKADMTLAEFIAWAAKVYRHSVKE